MPYRKLKVGDIVALNDKTKCTAYLNGNIGEVIRTTKWKNKICYVINTLSSHSNYTYPFWRFREELFYIGEL